MGAIPGRQRDRQQRQPEGGQPDADPLAALHAESEDPLCKDREEDEPSREGGLDHGERGQRQRRDVQQPRSERHEHAYRKPLRPEQRDGTAHRAPPTHLGRRVGAPVLEQESEVSRERAEECEEYAEV